jgi:DNA repair protein RecO (recombination protein O)
VKLVEADKIVTILTQGSGKVRAVAKGIRRTTSRIGSCLEPFTHVSLMLYAGRSLDAVTQAEILNPFRTLRQDFVLFSAGEAMLEAADKVAEEHEDGSAIPADRLRRRSGTIAPAGGRHAPDLLECTQAVDGGRSQQPCQGGGRGFESRRPLKEPQD